MLKKLQNKRPLQFDDLGRIEYLSAPNLSADGKHALYTIIAELYSYNTNTGKETRLTHTNLWLNHRSIYIASKAARPSV